MNKKRWLTLMESMGLKDSLECFDALRSAYSQKHRFYHTVEHINAMLRHFDQVGHLASCPAQLELAIWFHDAIYKIFSKTNERDSAEWAQTFLRVQGYNKEAVQSVYDLIMATQHNDEASSITEDAKLLVDIDLTILGATPEVYDEFESNVRKEYRLIPSFIYRKKRKELLASFLDNSSIYQTDYFRDKYESTARDNLSRVIAML